MLDRKEISGLWVAGFMVTGVRRGRATIAKIAPPDDDVNGQLIRVQGDMQRLRAEEVRLRCKALGLVHVQHRQFARRRRAAWGLNAGTLYSDYVDRGVGSAAEVAGDIARAWAAVCGGDEANRLTAEAKAKRMAAERAASLKRAA